MASLTQWTWKLQEIVKDWEDWHAAVHAVANSQTRFSNWITTSGTWGGEADLGTRQVLYPILCCALNSSCLPLYREERQQTLNLFLPKDLPMLAVSRAMPWVSELGHFWEWKEHDLQCIWWACYQIRVQFHKPMHIIVLAQSFPTLCDPMDYSLPGSSVHGIFQTRILELATISYSRGSSQPRDITWVSCISCISR